MAPHGALQSVRELKTPQRRHDSAGFRYPVENRIGDGRGLVLEIPGNAPGTRRGQDLCAAFVYQIFDAQTAEGDFFASFAYASSRSLCCRTVK